MESVSVTVPVGDAEPPDDPLPALPPPPTVSVTPETIFCVVEPDPDPEPPVGADTFGVVTLGVETFGAGGGGVLTVGVVTVVFGVTGVLGTVTVVSGTMTVVSGAVTVSWGTVVVTVGADTPTSAPTSIAPTAISAAVADAVSAAIRCNPLPIEGRDTSTADRLNVQMRGLRRAYAARPRACTSSWRPRAW